MKVFTKKNVVWNYFRKLQFITIPIYRSIFETPCIYVLPIVSHDHNWHKHYCTHSQVGPGPVIKIIRRNNPAIVHIVQRIQGCTSNQFHVHFPRETDLEFYPYFSIKEAYSTTMTTMTMITMKTVTISRLFDPSRLQSTSRLIVLIGKNDSPKDDSKLTGRVLTSCFVVSFLKYYRYSYIVLSW